MPQTFVVDQAATFQAVAFLSAEPKIVFGTKDRQETTAEGAPKWVVELVAGFRSFGKTSNEVIKVTVAGPNPAESLSPYTPVQLVGFMVGINPPEQRRDAQGREKIVGGTAWYRCDEIRPLTAPAPASTRRGE